MPSTPDFPHDAGLFADLPALTIPPEVRHIRSEGWSQPGLGGGDYIADASATAQLAARHPRCCTTTANGRIFRLADSQGAITVEHAGARGDTSGHYRINDQPAFQAAVDYAHAMGIARIVLGQPAYTLWAPPVLGNPVAHTTIVTGAFITIAADQRVHFVGAAGQRPRLSFRAPGGASFDGEQAGVNFQMLGSMVWRGYGFFLRGAPITRTAADRTLKRNAITLEGLVIDGGCRRDIVHGAAHSLLWDISHKGICVEPDRLGGDVTILNCEMIGWRGETVYCGNDTATSLVVRDSRFSDSNGQGLNPNGGFVDVDGVVIDNCFVGIEGWTGAAGGHIVNTTISNCHGPNGVSGGAFTLQGGKYGHSARSQYYAPSPVHAGEMPWGTLDITCRNCAHAGVGWWLKGRLVLIDTVATLGEHMSLDDGTQHVDLDILLSATRGTPTSVQIHGGAGKAGERLTDHIRLRITVDDAPATANLHLLPAVLWSGSLGDDIHVSLNGVRYRPAPKPVSPPLDFDPHFD